MTGGQLARLKPCPSAARAARAIVRARGGTHIPGLRSEVRAAWDGTREGSPFDKLRAGSSASSGETV